MDKEEHKDIIRRFLTERYGLDIEQWISLNEHLVSGHTYGDNMDVIKNYLKDFINERVWELAERITPEALETLRFDLMEYDNEWRDLIREELKINVIE